MKYFFLALAVTTAISAQIQDEAAFDDELLSEDMSLPCTPKPCVPVCKEVTKYIVHGPYKFPYQENVCGPDQKCLAAAAACQKKLMAAMIDADKKAKALEAASKAKNAAHASHAAKVKAAAAKAAKESATKLYAAKAKTMDARLKD